MRAKLKGLDSTDLPENPARLGFLIGLRDYEPADPSSFRLSITADIGPADAAGADNFSFVACTPRWLAAQGWEDEETHLWGRHFLFLREWSYEKLVSVVNDLIAEAEGPDWQAVAARLGRYMQWEYEDYDDSMSGRQW
jgi:hypothetical protein